MVENRAVERNEHALRLAERVREVWRKGGDVETDAKKFEEVLKTLGELAEKLDPEFKALSNTLKDLKGILEDAFEVSKFLEVAKLWKNFREDFLKTQRKDEYISEVNVDPYGSVLLRLYLQVSSRGIGVSIPTKDPLEASKWCRIVIFASRPDDSSGQAILREVLRQKLNNGKKTILALKPGDFNEEMQRILEGHEIERYDLPQTAAENSILDLVKKYSRDYKLNLIISTDTFSVANLFAKLIEGGDMYGINTENTVILFTPSDLSEYIVRYVDYILEELKKIKQESIRKFNENLKQRRRDY
jgi:hypothetical protein